jgi:hypothetical protein
MPTTVSDRLNGLTTSVAVKPPVRAVLVKDQADATENGIYIAATSDWTRSPDFDGALDVVQGTLVVSSNINGLYYRVTSANPIVIGTGEIEFEIVSTAFTQEGIGAVLNPQTDAEAAALVTPPDYSVPNHEHLGGMVLPERYGFTGLVPATDTAAFANALLVADQLNSFVGLSKAFTATAQLTWPASIHIIV